MAQPNAPFALERIRFREQVLATLLELSNTVFAGKPDTISFQETYRNHYLMCIRQEGWELLNILRAVFKDAAVKNVWQKQKYLLYISKVADLCRYWDTVEAVKYKVFKVHELGLLIWDERPIVWARIRRLMRLIGFIMRMWRGVTVYNNEKKYAPGGLKYQQCESNFYAFCQLEQLGKND